MSAARRHATLAGAVRGERNGPASFRKPGRQGKVLFVGGRWIFGILSAVAHATAARHYFNRPERPDETTSEIIRSRAPGSRRQHQPDAQAARTD